MIRNINKQDLLAEGIRGIISEQLDVDSDRIDISSTKEFLSKLMKGRQIEFSFKFNHDDSVRYIYGLTMVETIGGYEFMYSQINEVEEN